MYVLSSTSWYLTCLICRVDLVELCNVLACQRLCRQIVEVRSASLCVTRAMCWGSFAGISPALCYLRQLISLDRMSLRISTCVGLPWNQFFGDYWTDWGWREGYAEEFPCQGQLDLEGKAWIALDWTHPNQLSCLRWRLFGHNDLFDIGCVVNRFH